MFQNQFELDKLHAEFDVLDKVKDEFDELDKFDELNKEFSIVFVLFLYRINIFSIQTVFILYYTEFHSQRNFFSPLNF